MTIIATTTVWLVERTWVFGWDEPNSSYFPLHLSNECLKSIDIILINYYVLNLCYSSWKTIYLPDQTCALTRGPCATSLTWATICMIKSAKWSHNTKYLGSGHQTLNLVICKAQISSRDQSINSFNSWGILPFTPNATIWRIGHFPYGDLWRVYIEPQYILCFFYLSESKFSGK